MKNNALDINESIVKKYVESIRPDNPDIVHNSILDIRMTERS
jgi:hypothetical protein